MDYSMVRNLGTRFRHRFCKRPTRITDVFNKKRNKKAILSYITEPFTFNGELITHTNYYEAKSWAKLLDENGYSVDVYDFMDLGEIFSSDGYQFYCGFGHPFENSLRTRGRQGYPSVFYGTGCHPYFSNRGTVAKKIQFKDVHGEWPITGGREVESTWPLQLMTSDHYVVLGNDFVSNTYKNNVLRGKIHNLPVFYLGDVKGPPPKMTGDRRRNLLWFGSSGCLHKGLLDTFEALKRLPGFTLHIAGLSPYEESQLNLKEKYADLSDRVIDHGFLQVGSDAFYDVLNSCGILVFPSVSEGGAAGVLTALAHGASIPILTKATGLDLGEFGITIETGNHYEICESVEIVMSINNKEYENMTFELKKFIAINYNFDKYLRNMKNILNSIINN